MNRVPKKAATLPDHVHMYVSVPPKLSVSKDVGLIKGRSALMIFDRHPEYRGKGIGWSIKREPLLSGLPVKKERFA